MHMLLKNVMQNPFMARDAANHVNMAYANSTEEADRAVQDKATMLAAMGLRVHLCGVERSLPRSTSSPTTTSICYFK